MQLIDEATVRAVWRLVDDLVVRAHPNPPTDPLLAACMHAEWRRDAVDTIARTLAWSERDGMCETDATDHIEAALAERVVRLVDDDAELDTAYKRLATLAVRDAFTNIHQTGTCATSAACAHDMILTLPIVFPHLVRRGDTAALVPTIDLGHILSTRALVEWARGANADVIPVKPSTIRLGPGGTLPSEVCSHRSSLG